jgi:hypothetical protein
MEYVRICNVAGDVAEFGTYRGFTAHMLANNLIGDSRHLHLYDSWQGFPKISSVDLECKEVLDGKWGQGMCRVRDGLEVEISNSIDKIIPGRVRTIKGYYALDMPLPPAISVLHIDCDLYASTLTVLQATAPILSDGAVILFDEFNNNLASNNFGERRAFRETIADKCEPWFTYGSSCYAFIYHKDAQ